MAPTKRSFKTTSTRARQYEENESDSESQTAQPTTRGNDSQPNHAIQLMLQDMKQAMEARRTAKLQVLEKERQVAANKASAALAEAQNDLNEKIMTLQRHELQRLGNLVRQQHEIENRMVASILRIEDAYDAASQGLNVAITGRVEVG